MFQPIRGTDTRVTDLYKGDDYEFRVVAVNEAGLGKPSETTPPVTVRDPFGEFNAQATFWMWVQPFGLIGQMFGNCFFFLTKSK